MTLLVDTVCSFVAESILSEDCLKELHCNDAVDLHLFHIDLHRGSLFSNAFVSEAKGSQKGAKKEPGVSQNDHLAPFGKCVNKNHENFNSFEY